jgi:predicted RNA-binding protein with RPS1 domain
VGLKLFKKGEHHIVDVEILKRALRELVEREPAFFRDLFLDALRYDSRAADALLELFTKHPEARLKLAQAVAGSIAVPLNVATKDDIKAAVEELKKWTEEKFATKEDLKQYATKQDLETAVEQLKKWAEEKFATKQDLEELKKWAGEKFVTKEYFDAVIKRIEDKMATKERIESITISVEDSGREMVQFLLEQRGYRCAAERLRLDADYEFDIYCNAGVLTAVGEAKVRAGGRDVEKTLERAQELQRRQPEKISGKLVPVFYTLVAEPSAIQKAKELKIWLIESKREVVTLEEVLGEL